MRGSTATKGVFVDKGGRNSTSSGITGIYSKITCLKGRFPRVFHRESTGKNFVSRRHFFGIAELVALRMIRSSALKA